MQDLAERVIIEGLIEFGCLIGDIEEMVKKRNNLVKYQIKTSKIF